MFGTQEFPQEALKQWDTATVTAPDNDNLHAFKPKAVDVRHAFVELENVHSLEKIGIRSAKSKKCVTHTYAELAYTRSEKRRILLRKRHSLKNSFVLWPVASLFRKE